jgi:putative addiction module component (TIGR02574 family)
MSTITVLQLPLREKLQILEAIWEDLRERAEQFDIPKVQKELLDARRIRVAKGESQILDWDHVKHSIGRA